MFHKAWQYFSKHCASTSGSCNPGIWQHAPPRLSSIQTTSDAKAPVGTPTSEAGSENPDNRNLDLLELENKDVKSLQSQAHFATPLSFLFKSPPSGEVRKNYSSNDVISNAPATVNEFVLVPFAKPNGLEPNYEFKLVSSLQWLASGDSNLRRDVFSSVVESKSILPKPIQLSSKLEELVLSSDDDDILPNIRANEAALPETDPNAHSLEPCDEENTKRTANLNPKAHGKQVKKQEYTPNNVRSEAQQMLAGTKLVEQLYSEALNEEAISILRESNPGREDLHKALKYLQQSAKLGNSKAMFNLGVCFETGKFGEHNYPEALELYEKSWLSGNQKAGHNLKLLKLDMLKLDSANKTGRQV